MGIVLSGGNVIVRNILESVKLMSFIGSILLPCTSLVQLLSGCSQFGTRLSL